MIQSYQTLNGVEIIYRPKFYPRFGHWFAYVARPDDAHRPTHSRRLYFWPITEAQAMEFYERIRKLHQ